MILDIGCGRRKVVAEGDVVIGVDINRGTDADVIQNLNKFPYPFKDNCFDEIHCNEILEHVDDVFSVMDELHRIGKNRAIVKIKVPHFSSVNAYVDPTHKRSFTSKSFDFICENEHVLAYYSDRRYLKRRSKIEFWPLKEIQSIKPQEWIGLGIFANKFSGIYEKFFAFIFPAQSIYFDLEILK
ncbi:methyltransferase domain-containing protein [candidate division KSB1 bacterium]